MAEIYGGFGFDPEEEELEEEKEKILASESDIGRMWRLSSNFPKEYKDWDDKGLGEKFLRDNPDQDIFDIYEPTLKESLINPMWEFVQQQKAILPSWMLLHDAQLTPDAPSEERPEESLFDKLTDRSALLKNILPQSIRGVVDLAESQTTPPEPGGGPAGRILRGAISIFDDEFEETLAKEGIGAREAKLSYAAKLYEDSRKHMEEIEKNDPQYSAYLRWNADNTMLGLLILMLQLMF